MKYRNKMFSILTFILVGYIVYRIFRNDIYIWFCDNEKNKASCTVAGLLLKDQNNVAKATIYLQKACELEYPQGCYHLGVLYRENSQEASAQEYFGKACQLNYPPACQEKN